MIEFKNVSKVYQTREHEIRAIDQLSLTIPAGDYVAVCGPSGCGKSTLLSLIGGLALPTSGQVEVDQFVVSAASSAQRAQFRATDVGYVFQMFHLLPFLNGERLRARRTDVCDVPDRHTHLRRGLDGGTTRGRV